MRCGHTAIVVAVCSIAAAAASVTANASIQVRVLFVGAQGRIDGRTGRLQGGKIVLPVLRQQFFGRRHQVRRSVVGAAVDTIAMDTRYSGTRTVGSGEIHDSRKGTGLVPCTAAGSLELERVLVVVVVVVRCNRCQWYTGVCVGTRYNSHQHQQWSSGCDLVLFFGVLAILDSIRFIVDP